MIVKCISNIGKLKYTSDTITVGKEYLVLEINFSKMHEEFISYRLINDDGRPVIYDASCFTVVSNELKDMVVDYQKEWCTITPKRIFESTVGKDNINGFWAHLFETDDLEAIRLVESVASELNSEQGVALPKIKL